MREFNTIKEREECLREEFTDIIGEAAVDLMIHKGFCSAPASTKYHGSYPGGLFDHSYAVATRLQELTERLGLEWYHQDSPKKIGILHDLCKIDTYKKVEKPDGSITYEWDETPIVKGHGDKSAMYALRYKVSLTHEELACIIYHMGVYNLDKTGINDFNRALDSFPNILYTHMADMEASHIWKK